jgi:RimJ/RimL family protein N-acetyltransferase
MLDADHIRALVPLAYMRCTAEHRDPLIAFIAADTYPFNAVPQPAPDDVARWIDTGYYTESFWIAAAGGTRAGLLHYQDASAIHAEVHIRLHTPYRGYGIGTLAIRWLTDYLFEQYPLKHRVEGWTRADNIAMRRVFHQCGYVKEAHLRDDFPVGDGTFKDKVGYGILRADWCNGSNTPVIWDDDAADDEA